MLLKKELKDATGVDTPNLAPKGDSIALKLKLTKYILINWKMFQVVWMI